MRSIEDLLKLDYRISLSRDEEGDYFATVDELPGCMADGRTPNKAVENLREAMKSWMASRAAAGLEIPEPRDTADYSGRILVRMPKSLHRKLSVAAAGEGISLNQHIVSTLSEACGRASAIEAQQIVTYNSVFPNAPTAVSFPGAAGLAAYWGSRQVENSRLCQYWFGDPPFALQDTKVGYVEEQKLRPASPGAAAAA